MDNIKIEICAGSLSSAVTAQNGGANRIELCTALEVGGLTPSAAVILETRKRLTIGVHVLIRPRAGDFVYSDDEWLMIQNDIIFCRDNGCDGVVVGCLNNEGTFDLGKMEKMADLAYPMDIICHRAFDRTNNAEIALQQLIDLKYQRVLTSGQAASAPEGKNKLKELVALAENKIEIMPGSGVQVSNLKDLIEYTQARHFHLTAKKSIKSNFKSNDTGVKFNLNSNRENDYWETDLDLVRQAVTIANDEQ